MDPASIQHDGNRPHGPAATTPREAIRRCSRHLVASAAFSAMVNLLYIVPTIYMLQVYERVVPTGGLQTLLGLTVVLIVGLAALVLLDRLRGRLLQRAGLAIDLELAPLVHDLAFGNLRKQDARQAIRYLDTVRATLSGPSMLALFDAPWLPVYILVCAIMHPLIGALALLGALLLPGIAWLNERTIGRRLNEVQSTAMAETFRNDAVIDAAEEIRVLGMKRPLVARIEQGREEIAARQARINFDGLDYVAASKFLRLSMQSLALGLGAYLAVERQITPGAIFASSFLIARALAPVDLLVGNWKGVAAGRQAWAELWLLLENRQVARSHHTALPAPTGAMALEGVVMFQPGASEPTLKGISLTLRAGEIIAVIGSSGAGKSTLLRLLVGAARPDRGTVRIDGADLADWDDEHFARHVGYLPQSPTLLAGTIGQNISRFRAPGLGGHAVIDEMVVAAARRTGAHDMILRLHNGYEHELGAHGTGLSAGQAQKVALARATFPDPAIYVLDEPNAHLDAEGDEHLLALLKDLKASGKTVVIVSHRPTILPVVDTLIVMQDGRIAFAGPRDEILARIRPTPKAATMDTRAR